MHLYNSLSIWFFVFIYDFFFLFDYSVVLETKDGTVSVASAFAGHQEGNASA